MIEAQHKCVIDASQEQVWDYVKDINQWAMLFPGCKACEVIDGNQSRWTIKVGAGGLVKTVNVLVNVSEWSEPDKVVFSYQLESEPVIGSGVYLAQPNNRDSTDIQLQLTVQGSGQAAKMWEAVSKPLLPQMAKMFSGRLKAAIEEKAGVPVQEKPALSQQLKTRLKKLV